VTAADVQDATSSIKNAMFPAQIPRPVKRPSKRVEPCRCRQETSLERSVINRGILVAVLEDTKEIKHLSDCFLSKCQPPIRKQAYSLGWRLNSCNKYMSTVVVLAINATTGC
jgi:hypothetical protein